MGKKNKKREHCGPLTSVVHSWINYIKLDTCGLWTSEGDFQHGIRTCKYLFKQLYEIKITMRMLQL